MRAVFVGALGLASACSGTDRSTNPTSTVDPLDVILTPANLTIEVGQAGDFAVTISGGAEGASVSWICLSGEPQTITASKTADGCRVRGEEPGVATASVAVTKGNVAAVATATVTVTTPPPPPPPAPLEASLEPSDATIDQGHTAELVLQSTGGDSTKPLSWTCASSDQSVASATQTTLGCEVRGEGDGDATITARATRGSETADATATVVVPQLFPPLQVFFEPGSAAMSQAESLAMSLLILGGDPEAATSWTCTVADPEIVTVRPTAEGCEVTGFDAGATLLSAVVTRGTRMTQADANVTVGSVPGRSQGDPAPVDRGVRLIIEDENGAWTTLRLTLLETVSGAAASQMASGWSAQNGPPPSGFEYILARFRVEVLSQEDPNETHEESEANFESVSGTNVVQAPASVCCNAPTIEQQGFGGAVWEGWVDFLAEISDPLPVAAYLRGSPAEAWFELRPAP